MKKRLNLVIFFSKLGLLITLSGIMSCALGQDERFINKVFGKRVEKESIQGSEFIKMKVYSPLYQIDLNNDGHKEKLLLEKRNGNDYLHIHDWKNKNIFNYRFDVKGMNSRVYKISIKTISAKTNLLIFHYYEGNTSLENFYGTSRVYFLTIDNGDFNTFSIHKGPSVWEEVKSSWYGYRQKGYQLTVKDLNGDRIKEVELTSRGTNRVYHYSGEGRWRELKTL